MLFLKFSWFLGFIVLSLFLFLPGFFVIFHNAVMIYNSRNRSNYSTESQKEEKTCFNVRGKWNLNVQCMLTNLKGVYSWNKMWPLTSLVILKCESGTTLHAAQYKWQPGSVLISVLIISEIAGLDILFLCSAGQQAWLCSWLVLSLFLGFFS